MSENATIFEHSLIEERLRVTVLHARLLSAIKPHTSRFEAVGLGVKWGRWRQKQPISRMHQKVIVESTTHAILRVVREARYP